MAKGLITFHYHTNPLAINGTSGANTCIVRTPKTRPSRYKVKQTNGIPEANACEVRTTNTRHSRDRHRDKTINYTATTMSIWKLKTPIWNLLWPRVDMCPEGHLITSAALGPLLGSYLHVGFSRVLTSVASLPARLASSVLSSPSSPETYAPPQGPHSTSRMQKLHPDMR
jgi:hypothetical protein